MARFCSKCNKKIGFFEQDFNGMCKSCYDRKIEEERIRLQKEQEEKRKKEQEKREERRKQLEEKKRKEEERKKLEEQKKQEEEKRLEEENKLKKQKQEKKYREFKRKYLANARTLKLYLDIVDKLKHTVVAIFDDDSKENCIVDSFELIMKNIIYMLPQDLKLNDLKDVNNIQCFYEIIEKNKEILKLNQLLADSEYGNMYTEAFYEMKNMQKEKEIVCEGEYKIYLSNDEELLNDDIWSKKFKLEEHVYTSDYIALSGLLASSQLIYYCALIYIYNAVFYQYKSTFEKSELCTMFCKLSENTDNIDYILEKVYDIYIKLYKSLFDIELSKSDLSNMCIFYSDTSMKENIKKLCILNNQSLKDLNSKKSELKSICKHIFNNEITKHFFESILDNPNANIQLIALNILCIMFEELSFLGHIEGLLFKDIILYQGNIIDTMNELREEKELVEAEKERDRILNGDFSKEIEMQKQAVEYSNVQSGYEFEEYVANLYKKLGYTIEEVTKKSGDQGADVIAYKDNVKYVIQVKFYNNPVGNKAVQEVVGAIGMYKADKGIVVTNSTFTPSAVELANANNVELVDGEKIEEYKKEIIDDIPNYNENEEITEEYIDEIVNNWNELMEQKHFTQLDDTNRSEIYELLAKIYLTKELVNEYSDERVEKFIKAFSKYTRFGDDVFIENREDKDVIETYIKVAIYKVHFMKNVENILNDITINEEEKKKNIFYEYLLDNTEDVCVAYKVLALAEILDISSEDIIDEIMYYKEKFESNGDGTEYLHSKMQRLLDNMKQYTENLEENEKEKIEYWSSKLQESLDNDDNFDEDEEFNSYNDIGYDDDFDEDEGFASYDDIGYDDDNFED